MDYIEAWQGLEDCVRAGLIKSIGISNFNSKQIERLLEKATIKPVMHQVESHPYLPQVEMKKFCEERGMKLTAYSPLGNPGSVANDLQDKDKLLKDPLVLKLAEKYKKNVGQILIKFQVQRGIIVIPKSVSKERIKSNKEVFDFEMTAEEISALEAMGRNYRTCLFDICGISTHPIYPFNEKSYPNLAF